MGASCCLSLPLFGIKDGEGVPLRQRCCPWSLLVWGCSLMLPAWSGGIGKHTIPSLVGLCDSSCCPQGKRKSNWSCRYLTAAPLVCAPCLSTGCMLQFQAQHDPSPNCQTTLRCFCSWSGGFSCPQLVLLLMHLSWLMNTWAHFGGGAVPGKDRCQDHPHEPPSQCVHKVFSWPYTHASCHCSDWWGRSFLPLRSFFFRWSLSIIHFGPRLNGDRLISPIFTFSELFLYRDWP